MGINSGSGSARGGAGGAYQDESGWQMDEPTTNQPEEPKLDKTSQTKEPTTAELWEAGMIDDASYRNSSTGGPPSSKNRSNCFVATAVYGDINAPQVQVLREFRDSVLMENSLGRTVTRWYYSGIGKKVADFIRTQVPSTIPLARKGLDGLIKYYQSHKSK